MNFYNPYYYSVPTNLVQPKIGILGKLFGKTGVSIGNFINGTQKVLNIANQTIPLVKQIRPIVGNAKTMFKVMNEFKRVEKPTYFEEKDTENIDSNTREETNYISTNEGPVFFI
jgi:hypothetical protein